MAASGYLCYDALQAFGKSLHWSPLTRELLPMGIGILGWLVVGIALTCFLVPRLEE
jgi:hypothetical protein